MTNPTFVAESHHSSAYELICLDSVSNKHFLGNLLFILTAGHISISHNLFFTLFLSKQESNMYFVDVCPSNVTVP